MSTESSEHIAEFGEVRAEEDFDRKKLAAYLRDKLPGTHGDFEVLQFRGGHSNLTYLLRFPDKEWVVRRPPLGPLPVGGHDMSREYRVLSVLWRAFAPAPRGMLYCDDPSIIGAPFFVMERRRGMVIRMRQPLPPELDPAPPILRQISEGFIDTLADLHMVDFEKIGLAGFGRPAGFLERQITGWMNRWERAKTRELPLMNRLGTWFLANMPQPQPPAITHNDFFLHNVMLAADRPGNVIGVFDWEMATLGDPRVDLGVTLNYWRQKDDPEELIELSEGYPHTTRAGFLNRAELTERYARRTGRDLGMIDYYVAWAHWKTATVVEQIYVRYVRGQTTDPRFANMGKQPPILARAAARLASRLGFLI